MKRYSRKGLGRRKGGFTMVELMVATALGSMVLAGATFSFNMWLRSSMAVGNYADMSSGCRRALDVFASDVRMADDVTASSASIFEFTAFGAGDVIVEVRYAFDAATGEVTRTYDGISQTLLTEVNRFGFSYYNLSRVATTNPLSVKEVQIEAILMKRVIQLSNTDEIISARFMLRNRHVSS